MTHKPFCLSCRVYPLFFSVFVSLALEHLWPLFYVCAEERTSALAKLKSAIPWLKNQPYSHAMSCHVYTLTIRKSKQKPPQPYHRRTFPANTKHWSNVDLMLAQRLRRWPNINPTLDECILFTGLWNAVCWWSAIRILSDNFHLSVDGMCSN